MEDVKIERTATARGVSVPTFLYGTAWKEEATAPLVRAALDAGFRGIDTANQPRHYDEPAVGRALADALAADGGPDRSDLFVQTKFTFPGGQDDRIPYDASAPVREQVEQSFRSSLEHLGVDRVDSYVLHGPSQRAGLGDPDREAWRGMESLYEEGKARLLGVSNVRPDQLEALLGFANVPPAFVQNRCYAQLDWDAAVREICEANDIVYQAFSLLTANRAALSDPVLGGMAAGHGRTVPQVIFRFALEVGMIPLTGTTDAAHMAEDLAVYEFELEPDELGTIESIAA